jgi:hypothetical protein
MVPCVQHHRSGQSSALEVAVASHRLEPEVDREADDDDQTL